MLNYKLISSFKAKGDQPKAISALTKGLQNNLKYQTLLGVTGSGKTFTIANVIACFNKPTLIISHNKTLAAQLYNEFKTLFPYNKVEYFVSFYDYYQPEAYLPQTDTYIEKDSSINEEIDRMRLAATSALLQRNDVIIVASVSAIYNLGSPEEYSNSTVFLKKGDSIPRNLFLKKLIDIHYERSDLEFKRGKFRIRGDVIDIFPSYSNNSLKIEYFGDKIESLKIINLIDNRIISTVDNYTIYPAKHFITSSARLQKAISSIKKELKERKKELQKQKKQLEANRLEARTNYDLELLVETGYCHGIENYSRHLNNRLPGERPYTLLDYFPKDYLLIIDESHVSLPQIRGMQEGDRSRKMCLVEYGFRLPSALDNRPLKFHEFESLINKAIFTSATPGPYELEKCPQVVEQINRPTGLLDPKIIVRPTKDQIPDLIKAIKNRLKRNERIIVITLTKKMSEDLSFYLDKLSLKVRYLHCEIDTLERVSILNELRLGSFDVLVGINLLREGIDLPEVSLVAILDADKEGFLRSERSLIQLCGRASRHINATVIMYADIITSSMQKTITETKRRRSIQKAYNKKHHIKPLTICKPISETFPQLTSEKEKTKVKYSGDIKATLKFLYQKMYEAAHQLEFEKAIEIRNEIYSLEKSTSTKACKNTNIPKLRTKTID
ncbi:MAG: excinuclease ABC subunit UvrB [bacterium]|nr:excinuclease ABC subunit UvrB [bacterium]